MRNLNDRTMHNNNQQSKSLESGLPSVGSIVWAAGRSRAQQALSLYANLDYLRPYFDVEPKEVIQRLVRSLIPGRTVRDENIKSELYGPSMIAFTLAAILIYQMKLSSHSVQDGTLIGTSFLVCFGYWIGSSFAISSLSFIFNTQLTLMQILSVNGYALFSHCIVLIIATFIHTSHDHVLFYGLWAIIGGAAAIRLASIVMSRTLNPHHRYTAGLCIAAIHMFYLLYLHFAYHTMAETVAHALNNERLVPSDPIVNIDSPVVSAIAPVKAITEPIRDIIKNSSTTTQILLSTTTKILKQ